MNHCEFDTPNKGATCPRCGNVLRRDYPTMPSRLCDRQDEATLGLGDMVAHGLEQIGITKERVEILVGECGCDQRQKWLNELGKRVGL